MGRRFILDLRKTVQRITSVFIRLGTCPTGIFATTFKVFMSMATTELSRDHRCTETQPREEA